MLRAAFFAASFFAASVSADLGKTILFPDGFHGPLSGLDNLPVPAGSYYGISVPLSCSGVTTSLNCNAHIILLPITIALRLGPCVAARMLT